MEFRRMLALVISAIGLLAVSCSPHHRLIKDFNRDKTSIQYVRAGTNNPIKNGSKILIKDPVLADSKFPPIGQVDKIKSQVIPLIVYNGWKHDYICRIGESQVQEEIGPFVKESIIDETKRYGIFEVDTDSHSDYQIEIEIDSLGASGPFVNSGSFVYLFFLYFTETYEHAGPGSAYCRFHYRVMRGEKVVLEDFISNQSSVELLQPANTSFKKFHGFYRANLVECLGYAMRKNVTQLVADLNTFFDKEKTARYQESSMH